MTGGISGQVLGLFFILGFCPERLLWTFWEKKIENRGEENRFIFNKKLGAQVCNDWFNSKSICFRTSVPT